ncbi:hypothetical protein TNCV_3620921 [Trichonephila clavipes]|nr:hypothetical protein TNCV_3620921 [Trichonephila clavipes]
MIHNCRTSSSGNHIFINKFTFRELNFALRALDLRKSPGPDGIHGFMIGHLGPHGMQTLLDTFNFFLENLSSSTRLEESNYYFYSKTRKGH